MTRLPSQPPLRPGEGLAGFVGHLALVNGLTTRQLLADIGVAGFPFGRRDTRLLLPTDSVLAELSDLTDRTPGELKVATAWSWGVQTERLLSGSQALRDLVLRPARVAACPDCPPGYVPLTAHHGLLAACPDHDKLLVQNCPRCAAPEPIAVDTAATDPCCVSCGLRTEAMPAGLAHTLDALTATLAMLDPSRGVPHDIGYLCELLTLMGHSRPLALATASTEPYSPVRPGTTGVRRTIAWAPLYLPAAWEIATGGPFADKLLLRLGAGMKFTIRRSVAGQCRIQQRWREFCDHMHPTRYRLFEHALAQEAVRALELPQLPPAAPWCEVATLISTGTSFQDLVAELMGAWPADGLWPGALEGLLSAAYCHPPRHVSSEQILLGYELAVSAEAQGRTHQIRGLFHAAQRRALTKPSPAAGCPCRRTAGYHLLSSVEGRAPKQQHRVVGQRAS